MLSKIKVFSLLVIGSLVIGILAVGCGTSAPQIQTSSQAPTGLSIRGTVYANTNVANASQSTPLAGAVLSLSGDTANRTTTTNANGEYVFGDLTANNTGFGQGYTIVATKEGYQRQIITSLNFGSGILSPVQDGSVLTQDFNLIDNPVVLSISPAPRTIVTAAQTTFTVAFNEAMDQSSVKPSFTCTGIRASAVGDTQTLTATWSADSKVMYLTTNGASFANVTYQLQVNPGASRAADLAGNLLDPLTAAGNSGGLAAVVYNAANYLTAANGAPDAPTGLLVTVNDKTTIDFSDAIVGGDNVQLSWINSSGLVSGYRVYVAKSASGPWAKLGADSPNTFAGPTITNVNDALYIAGSWNIDASRNLAFVTDSIYFKVVAFNGDGEGTAAVSSALRDSVKPRVFTAGVVRPCYRNPVTPALFINTPGALTDYSLAGATQNMGCYIRFNEPMDISALKNTAKYIPTTGAGTVASATVVSNVGGVAVVQLIFTAGNPNPPGNTITVATDTQKDLSGNLMDDTTDAGIVPTARNIATIN